MFEPTPRGAIKWDITPEPELAMSDQVCEPAAPSIAVRALVEYEGIEVSDDPPTHPPIRVSVWLSQIMTVCLEKLLTL